MKTDDPWLLPSNVKMGACIIVVWWHIQWQLGKAFNNQHGISNSITYNIIQTIYRHKQYQTSKKYHTNTRVFYWSFKWGLDPHLLLRFTFTFQPFFFFFSTRFFLRQLSLFMHCSSTVHALFMRPIATLLKKNIKNGSHGTIYTFKNYFATVFSVFSFSKNNLYPNRPLKSNMKLSPQHP